VFGYKRLQLNLWLACLLATGTLVSLIAAIYLNAQATPLADAPIASLPCASYAPFRRPSATPFDPTRPVTPAEIEADLVILRKSTACIRTYGVGNGLDAVPAIAQRLGFRLHQGVWLGKDIAQNDLELTKAIALTQKYPGTIASLVVGNEVLLRRDLSAQALEKVLIEAKARTTVPITYADVWEFWLQNAALAQHVDVVTIHILPYWEDHPVAVSQAVDHVFNTARRVRAAFAPKPIWIGETGWPTDGRQRAGAIPGQIEQTRFVRELLSRTTREPVSFNFIEAFDQPWKRALEGAMGGHWGMFAAAGEAKVTLTGPVAAYAGADRDVRLSVGTLVVALLIGLALSWRTRNADPWVASCIMALLAICAVVQWRFMTLWNLNALDWWSSGFALAIVSACTVAFALAHAHSPRRASLLLSITLFIAASHALLLLFDGRYRGFSWALYLSVTVASLCALLYRVPLPGSAANRLLSIGLLVSALAVGVAEGFANTQAWRLVLLWLLLSLAVFRLSSTQSPQPGERR
jgi:exo-beta-1,3-glucanase (GH17 family)